VPYQMVIESARLKGAGIGRYKGIKQIAFLHKFATQKLENYKKELLRKGYEIDDESPLFIAYNKQQKVVGLKAHSISDMFTDVSLAAFANLEKKRFSPHDFREFFESRLESANIHDNVIAPFLGHKVHGVDFHYSSHEIDELREKFCLALPYLLPQSVESLKIEQDKTRNQLLSKFANVTADNERLNNAFERQLKENWELKQSIEEAKKDSVDTKELVKKLLQKFVDLNVKVDLKTKIDTMQKAGESTEPLEKFLVKLDTEGSLSAKNDRKTMKKALDFVISAEEKQTTINRKQKEAS
jgi:hypothetical protein